MLAKLEWIKGASKETLRLAFLFLPVLRQSIEPAPFADPLCNLTEVYYHANGKGKYVYFCNIQEEYAKILTTDTIEIFWYSLEQGVLVEKGLHNKQKSTCEHLESIHYFVVIFVLHSRYFCKMLAKKKSDLQQDEW